MPRSVVVIGGGITGLAAAFRLKQRFAHKKIDATVLLLEASARTGGLILSAHRDGYLLEAGADCFLTEKPAALRLCEELGIKDELISTQPDCRRSFVVHRGKLAPIPEGFYLLAPSRLKPFLDSPLLSWAGKARVCAERLLPRQKFSDESLGSFVRRRFGRELLDRLAQPLASGIYTADPDRLSLRATFPQFAEMEDQYGSVLLGLKQKSRAALGGAVDSASGARYGLFSTFKRGMGRLSERLTEVLGPTVVRTNAAVAGLSHDEYEGLWHVRLANGELLKADGVCMTLAAFQSAALVRPLSIPLADELEKISYRGAATLNLAFRRGDIANPLDGFGFVSPRVDGRLVSACTFVHRKFAGRAPGGFALLRGFLTDEGAALKATDEAIAEKAVKELAPLLGLKGRPLFWVLWRYPNAMPQYEVGHLERVLRIQELTKLPSFALAGSWQQGVGIPNCIESAEKAADIVATAIEVL